MVVGPSAVRVKSYQLSGETVGWWAGIVSVAFSGPVSFYSPSGAGCGERKWKWGGPHADVSPIRDGCRDGGQRGLVKGAPGVTSGLLGYIRSGRPWRRPSVSVAIAMMRPCPLASVTVPTVVVIRSGPGPGPARSLWSLRG